MCGLCGILGDGTHWADGLVRPGESLSASAVPWLRRQARRRRVALGNAVLRHYGLSLADWQGSGFVLRSRTGSAEMVDGLGDLWPKAERLRGRPLDPLDPALLDALDAACPE
jgi:hypothetical protein